MFWHNAVIPLHQQNEKDMNATDTMTRLSAMFSSDESFAAMIELVDDLGLELRDVVMA